MHKHDVKENMQKGLKIRQRKDTAEKGDTDKLLNSS